MTDYNRVNSSNLDAVTLAGVPAPANRGGDPTTYGVTLVAATTYYFSLGAPRAPAPAETPLISVHLRGSAALTITQAVIEDCVFMGNVSPDGRGAVDVSDFDQVPGNWIPENPTAGITSHVEVTGTGWSITGAAATAATAGTGAGGAMWTTNLGSRRQRLKVVVGAVGGLVRVGAHGKAGG